MTADDPPVTESAKPVRVVALIDMSGGSDNSLAEACALAELRQAELVAVFVEDEGLERAMGLDVVRIVTAAAVRDVDPPSWRRGMRALASLRRGELSRIAEPRRVRWSSIVEQGSLHDVLLRTTTDVDLVVVGHGGRRPRGHTGGVVAVVADRRAAPIVVELARALAEQSGRPLSVWVDGDDALVHHVRSSLPPGADLHRPHDGPRGLAAALRQSAARLVVASAPSDDRYLEELRAGLPCPLVLVTAAPSAERA